MLPEVEALTLIFKGMNEPALASRSVSSVMNALKTNPLQTVDVRALAVVLLYPRCLCSGGVLINCSYQPQTQFIVCEKADYGKANGFNSTIQIGSIGFSFPKGSHIQLSKGLNAELGSHM